MAVEMSCPWLDNRVRKDSEKREKFQPMPVGAYQTIPWLQDRAAELHHGHCCCCCCFFFGGGGGPRS